MTEPKKPTLYMISDSDDTEIHYINPNCIGELIIECNSKCYYAWLNGRCIKINQATFLKMCGMVHLETIKTRTKVSRMIRTSIEEDNVDNLAVDLWGGAGPDCLIEQREAA